MLPSSKLNFFISDTPNQVKLVATSFWAAYWVPILWVSMTARLINILLSGYGPSNGMPNGLECFYLCPIYYCYFQLPIPLSVYPNYISPRYLYCKKLLSIHPILYLFYWYPNFTIKIIWVPTAWAIHFNIIVTCKFKFLRIW